MSAAVARYTMNPAEDTVIFGDALADVGQTKLVDHQKLTTRSTASRTRSASGRYSRSSV